MIGIYPGTFDPVHNGHMAFCRLAIEQLGLEQVILLPERQPREKQGVTRFTERVAMLELAIKNIPNARVVALDDEQFTVQSTLPKLQHMFGRELSLLVGSDVIKMFGHRWPDLKTLLEQAELVVGLRQNDSAEEVAAALRALDYPVRFRCIDAGYALVASSGARAGAGHHLDPGVWQYAQKKRLYR